MDRTDAVGKRKQRYTTKKCPYCSTYVKLDATRCEGCNRRIGADDGFGIAKKPVNVTSYIVALAAVAAMVGYFVWIFTK
jgi:hypothetical protein